METVYVTDAEEYSARSNQEFVTNTGTVWALVPQAIAAGRHSDQDKLPTFPQVNRVLEDSFKASSLHTVCFALPVRAYPMMIIRRPIPQIHKRDFRWIYCATCGTLLPAAKSARLALILRCGVHAKKQGVAWSVLLLCRKPACGGPELADLPLFPFVLHAESLIDGDMETAFKKCGGVTLKCYLCDRPLGKKDNKACQDCIKGGYHKAYNTFSAHGSGASADPLFRSKASMNDMMERFSEHNVDPIRSIRKHVPSLQTTDEEPIFDWRAALS